MGESWRNQEPITGHFADSDLLIFGDIERPPARSKIIRLCEMRYAAYTRTAHMHARATTHWDLRLRVGILSILTTSAKLRVRIAQHRSACRQLETTRGRKTFIFCYCDYIGNKIKPYVIFNRGIISSWIQAAGCHHARNMNRPVSPSHTCLSVFYSTINWSECDLCASLRAALRFNKIKWNRWRCAARGRSLPGMGRKMFLMKVNRIVFSCAATTKKPFAIYDYVPYNS